MLSMEDRIHKMGNHKPFSAAVKKFRASRKGRTEQHVFYEALTNLGADPEEADEFINLELENGDGE